MNQAQPPAPILQAAEPDHPDTLEFGDYQYQSFLGQGGQGSVCLYRHVATGVDYAVKFDPKNRKCTNVLTECLFLRDHGPNMTKFP